MLHLSLPCSRLFPLGLRDLGLSVKTYAKKALNISAFSMLSTNLFSSRTTFSLAAFCCWWTCLGFPSSIPVYPNIVLMFLLFSDWSQVQCNLLLLVSRYPGTELLARPILMQRFVVSLCSRNSLLSCMCLAAVLFCRVVILLLGRWGKKLISYFDNI